MTFTEFLECNYTTGHFWFAVVMLVFGLAIGFSIGTFYGWVKHKELFE